jgi:hypothetical protein
MSSGSCRGRGWAAAEERLWGGLAAAATAGRNLIASCPGTSRVDAMGCHPIPIHCFSFSLGGPTVFSREWHSVVIITEKGGADSCTDSVFISEARETAPEQFLKLHGKEASR